MKTRPSPTRTRGSSCGLTWVTFLLLLARTTTWSLSIPETDHHHHYQVTNDDENGVSSSSDDLLPADDSHYAETSSSTGRGPRLLMRENGLVLLRSPEAFLELFRSSHHHHHPPPSVVSPTISTSRHRSSTATHNGQKYLWLLLIADPTCPLSRSLVTKVEEAQKLLVHYWSTTRPSLTTSPEEEEGGGTHREGATVGGSEQQQQEDQPEGYAMPLMAKINVPDWDRTTLMEEFGVTALPALIFVMGEGPRSSTLSSSQSSHQPPFYLEYAGPVHTPYDIFQTVWHFFHRLVVLGGDIQYLDDFVHVRPRNFATQAQLEQEIQKYAPALLPHSAVQPALPPAMAPWERQYIHWLLEEAIDPSDYDDFLVLVQHRCLTTRLHQKRRQQQRKDVWYETFNQFSRAVASRRDRLFVAVSDCRQPDGSITVWALPVSSEDATSFTARPAEQPWEEYLSRNVYLPPSVPEGKQDWSVLDRQPMKEFLIQVSTPSLLWMDRQMTAPIAFPLYRQVHAVLFVDLHYPAARLDWASSSTFSTTFPETPPRTQERTGGSTSPPDSPAHLPWAADEHCAHTKAMIKHFRQACRQHKRQDRSLQQDMVCLVVPSTETRILTTFGMDIWTPLDDDAATVVVGAQGEEDGKDRGLDAGDSTRRRPEEASPDQAPDETRNDSFQIPPTTGLPTLLVTDQRHPGGTRRCYLDLSSADLVNNNQKNHDVGGNNTVVDGSDRITNFLSDFWKGRLVPEYKSSGRARTTENGIRILSTETMQSELLRPPADVNQTAPGARPTHALLFLTSPTCGHCKRFSVVWNRFAELLKQLGWLDRVLSLYQLDVTTDEPVGLGQPVTWLPDVYYLSPDRKHLVQYNETDDLGDGAGRITHVLEMVEWLLQEHVGSFTDDEIRTLLHDL